MLRDPRNPDPAYMVPTESTHSNHAALRQTLVLLKIELESVPVYFVVEGLSEWPEDKDRPMLTAARYFYEEHTCPTNFICIPMISHGGDHDPHGVFRFVDAVWMTDEYQAAEQEGDADNYLLEAFPQLRGPV